MKKSLVGAFFAFALLFTPSDIQAESACSYEDKANLNAIAAKVDATYEVVDIYDGKATQLDSGFDVDPIVDVYVRGFNINILNITDEIYIKVTNNFDSAEKTYKKEDTQDGIVTFQTKNNEAVIIYTIDIYANVTSCSGEKLRTFTFQTPAYNMNSEFEVCHEYPDFYYCQEFLSSGTIGFNEFFTQLDKYKETKQEEQKKEEEKKKSFATKIKELYNDNKLLTNIIIIIIIISGVTTTVILVKKRRSRVL